jgi:hypothetical protein
MRRLKEVSNLADLPKPFRVGVDHFIKFEFHKFDLFDEVVGLLLDVYKSSLKSIADGYEVGRGFLTVSNKYVIDLFGDLRSTLH